MSIAFIGLGTMGKYMALNLIKSGELIVVSDVVDKAFAEFTEKGVAATTAVAETAKTDVIRDRSSSTSVPSSTTPP